MDFRRCFRLLQSTFHRQKPNRYLRQERNSYRGLNNDISLKQQWKWHHRSSSSRILYATGVVGTASAFSWDDQGISNEEIDELVEEVKLLKLGSHLETEDLPSTQDKNVPSTWEIILDKPRIKIWKVFDEKLGKTIYKVLGRNSEVSADHFYVVQTDLEYRKAWDKLVLEIDIVDEKCEGDQQVLRWTTAFPYPFKPREYVYVRRSEIFDDMNLYAICSRSVDHPGVWQDKSVVRVPFYISHMIIKPHTAPNQPGMDFLLTYSDDPQTVISGRLTSWVTSVGIPDYLKKVYAAAEGLMEWSEGREKKLKDIYPNLIRDAPAKDCKLQQLGDFAQIHQKQPHHTVTEA